MVLMYNIDSKKEHRCFLLKAQRSGQWNQCLTQTGYYYCRRSTRLSVFLKTRILVINNLRLLYTMLSIVIYVNMAHIVCTTLHE